MKKLAVLAVEAAIRRRTAQLEESGRDPAASQSRLLRGLLGRAAATRLGRKHGFSKIRTPEEYRSAVPLADYETASPEWHEAFEGARDVTWPGHVRYFALSSGTTAGNKLLPVTREAIASNKRSGAALLAFMARRVGAETILDGKFFYLGGSTSLRKRGRSLYGDASGIMGRHIPFYAHGRYLPEADIACVADWERKIRMIVERYLTSRVRVLSACPSWAALLFKEMIASGGGNAGTLWPDFACFVSYGMAFEPYGKSFEEYIGRRIAYMDTYSSSEAGMTAIQEEPGGPLRMLVDNGVYYEFIPAERAGDAKAPRLHFGEVETGRDYALVVSTNGGIWAYPLGDVIRFESVQPPRVRFAGRTRIGLSAFGEHVTLEMMEKAVGKACEKTGAVLSDYTVWPRYPSVEEPVPVHRWIFEFDSPPGNESEFMKTVDSEIRARSEDYDTHRRGDYGLRPPVMITVSPGTFYEWMKEKGKLGGQHKVPRVARSDAMAEELLKISDRRVIR
ncbi:MAG: GH3 auxin-responsive promoter family protein [Kiritimatiellia bacterium]